MTTGQLKNAPQLWDYDYDDDVADRFVLYKMSICMMEEKNPQSLLGAKYHSKVQPKLMWGFNSLKLVKSSGYLRGFYAFWYKIPSFYFPWTVFQHIYVCVRF